MKYKLWDKVKMQYVHDDEYFNIMLGNDGRIYEFYTASSGSTSWVTRDDVTDKYEIHLIN